MTASERSCRGKHESGGGLREGGERASGNPEVLAEKKKERKEREEIEGR